MKAGQSIEGTGHICWYNRDKDQYREGHWGCQAEGFGINMAATRTLVPKGPWVEMTWWKWCLRRIIQAAGGQWPDAVRELLHLTVSLKHSTLPPSKTTVITKNYFWKALHSGWYISFELLAKGFLFPFLFSYLHTLTNALPQAEMRSTGICFPLLVADWWKLAHFKLLLCVCQAEPRGCGRGINLRHKEVILASCSFSSELLLSREKANPVHYLKRFCDLSTGYWPTIKWPLLKTSEWIFNCCLRAGQRQGHSHSFLLRSKLV